MATSDVREYWDRRPCNIRHSLEPIGSRKYFDEVRARKYFVEPHIPLFADFPAWSGKRVLEIGCGIGTDTVEFVRHGADVTAVDLSPESAELTRKRLEVYGLLEHASVYTADAERLPEFVPVAPYDLVYSFGVLHHTPHPARALYRLAQYADDKTELRLMLYHRLSTKAVGTALRYGWPLREFDDAVARQSEAQHGCPVTRTYTRASAQALLTRTGWEATSMRVAHIFPWRIKEYVQYRYRYAFPWNILPRRLLERRLGWHLLICARRMP